MTQDLAFQRADGLRICGKLYIPEKEKAKQPYPLAVFCHGMGADHRHLEGHASGMAEEGICVCLFDFCGGGAQSLSDGSMQKMTIRSECLDLRTVLEGLWRLPYIDRRNTFLMGESLGGLVAALTGARLHDKVKGLILWYPAFNLPSRIRQAFPRIQQEARRAFGMGLGTDFYKDGITIDSYAAVESYAGPVLLIHGDQDQLVPLSWSETAMDIYEHAQLVIVPGGGHGLEEEHARRAREYSTVFIKEHIRESL